MIQSVTGVCGMVAKLVWYQVALELKCDIILYVLCKQRCISFTYSDINRYSMIIDIDSFINEPFPIIFTCNRSTCMFFVWGKIKKVI